MRKPIKPRKPKKPKKKLPPREVFISVLDTYIDIDTDIKLSELKNKSKEYKDALIRCSVSCCGDSVDMELYGLTEEEENPNYDKEMKRYRQKLKKYKERKKKYDKDYIEWKKLKKEKDRKEKEKQFEKLKKELGK